MTSFYDKGLIFLLTTLATVFLVNLAFSPDANGANPAIPDWTEQDDANNANEPSETDGAGQGAPSQDGSGGNEEGSGGDAGDGSSGSTEQQGNETEQSPDNSDSSNANDPNNDSNNDDDATANPDDSQGGSDDDEGASDDSQVPPGDDEPPVDDGSANDGDEQQKSNDNLQPPADDEQNSTGDDDGNAGGSDDDAQNPPADNDDGDTGSNDDDVPPSNNDDTQNPPTDDGNNGGSDDDDTQTPPADDGSDDGNAGGETNEPPVGPVNPQTYISGYYVKDDIFSLPDPSKINMIYYAFGGLNTDGSLKFTTTNDKQLKQLVALKAQNPDLKVIVSFIAASEDFEYVSKNSRAAFVNNLAAFVDAYGVDGIDIDWEFPGYPGGSENWNYNKELTVGFYKALGDMLHSKGKLLTAATGNAEWSIRYLYVSEIKAYVDYFNLMTYDYRYNAYGQAVHDSNLYQKSGTSTSQYQVGSADSTVQLYLSKGVDPKQLVLGVSFYAIDYELTEDPNDKSANAIMGRAVWMSSVEEKINSGNYYVLYDEVAKASYLVNKQTGKFAVSYTSAQAIADRAEYVKALGLAGLFSWNYAQDNSKNHDLVESMYVAMMVDAGSTSTPSPQTIPVSLELDGPSSLVRNDSQKITAIVTYSDGTTAVVTTGLTFVSSSTSVATVDSDGTVTAKAAGTATITVTYGDVSASLDVKVRR